MTVVIRCVDKNMDTKKLNELAKKVSAKFPGKGYGKFERLADVMEELGELSASMVVVEGVKKSRNQDVKYTKEDVKDAIADTLFALNDLANQYEINIFDEYEKVLINFSKRIEEGEFYE